MVKGKTRFKVRQEMASVLLERINSELETKLPPEQYLKWQKIMLKESKLIFSFDLFKKNLNLFKLSHR
jgi:hypothetical protein